MVRAASHRADGPLQYMCTDRTTTPTAHHQCENPCFSARAASRTDSQGAGIENGHRPRSLAYSLHNLWAKSATPLFIPGLWAIRSPRKRCPSTSYSESRRDDRGVSRPRGPKLPEPARPRYSPTFDDGIALATGHRFTAAASRSELKISTSITNPNPPHTSANGALSDRFITRAWITA